MIFYLISGAVVTLGVLRMFVAFMGNIKNHERFGVLINVYVYTIAIFFPFSYMLGVVLFGLMALYMLSLSFEAGILIRILATASTFITLTVVRFGLSFVYHDINGVVFFALAALVFFLLSSFALDIRLSLDKNNHNNQLKKMRDKTDNEKEALISMNQKEISAIKNYTISHLTQTLKLLDVYKLEDTEASIKDLIARNKT